MTTTAELVLQHVGHHCTIVEQPAGIALKCITCAGRLTDLSSVLGIRPSSVKSTSTSKNTHTRPRTQRDPLPAETCPHHPGEYALTCRCCRSETLADETRQPTQHTRSDPLQNPAWQAARTRFHTRP